MKTTKIKGLDNPEIKVKDEEKPTFPHDIFQPYARVSLTGASGCGKSNSFINLFDKMYPHLDKVYVVSPTIDNDAKQRQAFMGKENVMVFDEPTEKLIRDIQKDAQRIHEQYNGSIKVKKAWDKWRQNGWDEMKLNGNEMALLDGIQWDIDNIKWKHSRRPNLLLWCDDLQGTPVLRGKALEALTIKARHHNINLFMANQTWVGVSPNIRRNLSGYMVFWTPDHKVLKGIYEEVMGLFKDYDHFIKCYEFATNGGRHNFLYIDMNDKTYPLRRNFNEPIVLSDDKEN